MKNKAILCLMLFLGGINLNVIGQNNLEILDENKMWSTVDFYWFPSGPHFTTYNKFEGDTSINDLAYKKVWKADDPDASDWNLVGFIRQMEQTYYIRNLWSEEGIIYKFGLTEGDTVTINNTINNYYPFTTQVLSVDSILIEPFGEYRKRMKMAGSSEFYEYWIEGVGSNAGIVKSCRYISYLTGGGSYLLCEWENGEKIFDNEEFDYCYDSTVGIDDQMDSQSEFINISPMPLTDHSLISFINQQGEQIQIKIFDLYGQQVFQQQIRATEKLSISKSQFIPGIYVVMATSGGNLKGSAKLIVQ